MARLSARLPAIRLTPLLTLVAAGAFALSLAGCGMMGGAKAPASAGEVGASSPAAAGGAAGAGTQNGPSGGTTGGPGAATSPAP